MMHTSYSRLLLLAVLLITPLASKAQETWSSRTSGVTAGLWSIAYGSGQWIAVGESGTILSSVDGITWSSRVSGYTSRWLVSVGYGASTWVVVGESGLILTSSDGSSWTARTSGTTSRINGVTYGGGRWIAVAESGELLTSTDSRTWTKLSPSTDRLRGITYSYGQFVITGDNGLIRTTIDSTDYSSNLLPSGFFVESVIYGRKTFVAVGEDGYVISSPDAVTWNNVKSGTTSYLRGVTFFNGQFVAVGTSGVVLTAPSPDSAWTARQTGSTATLTAVASSDATIVAVGSSGTILQSTPPAAAPTINTAPAAISEAAGSNVLFNVVATGSPPLSYQWLFNGAAIAGETSDTLFLANVSTAQAGNYSVTVKNSLGAVTSGSAALQLRSATPDSIIDSTFTPIPIASGVKGIVEQADGKIIVALTQGTAEVLQRYNKDGSQDLTYVPKITGSIAQLKLQPDGKLLVVGSTLLPNSTYAYSLIRLNVDGGVDTGFAGVGVTGSNVLEVAFQSNKILARSDKLTRYNSDGSKDPAFMEIAASAFCVDSKDRIYVVDSGKKISRLLSSGIKDNTFSDIIVSLIDYYMFVTKILVNSNDDLIVTESGQGVRGGPWIRFYVLTSKGEKIFPIPSIGSGSTGGTVLAITEINGVGDLYVIGGSAVMGVYIRPEFTRYNKEFKKDYSFEASYGASLTGVYFLANSSGGGVYLAAQYATSAFVSNYAKPSYESCIKKIVYSNALAPQPIIFSSLTPEIATATPNSTLNLSVKAAGTGPITYAWKSTVTLGNADQATATFPTNVSGTYYATVTATNRAGSVTSSPIRIVIPESIPVFSTQPSNVSSSTGRSAILTAAAGGTSPITYQWYRGTTLVGTGATLTLKNLSATDAGEYTVVATNSLGTTRSSAAQLTVDGLARLANISTRASAGAADNTLIAGFVISGPTSKSVLIRGIGRGLSDFGLTGVMQNPKITLYDGAGKSLSSIVGYDSSKTPSGLVTGVGAFPYKNSYDCAMLSTLTAGNYTVQLTDTNNATGVALIEVYEADDNSNRISNLSSRAYVGAGASIAIGGISVQGDKPRQFLIRGVGPTLKDFGVSTALLDPVLKLTTALGAPVAENDDWSTSTNKAALVAATAKLTFPFTEGSLDAAILITLSAGNYTALISGKNDTTGVALVEVYEIP